jgi:hypothetical protein
MTTHNTGETTPLARSNHVDVADALECVRGQNLTNLTPVLLAVCPELANESLWLAPSLGHCSHARGLAGLGLLPSQSHDLATLTSRGTTALTGSWITSQVLPTQLVSKSHLHSFVAITLHRSQLQNMTRPHLKHSHTN